MRYHTNKPSTWTTYYGTTYRCNHPIYRTATLYLEDNVGLCVIQQRFNPTTKSTTWGAIDPWLCDPIYLAPGFYKLFKELARPADENNLYPTITVRQIMWKLRMKPIPRERWETVFDRKLV